MSYRNYYLKFPDEETQKQFFDPESLLIIEGFFFSIIGVLYDQGEPVTGPDGIEYHQQIAKPGWHVNARSKLPLPEELKPYQIFPVSPSEVWL